MIEERDLNDMTALLKRLRACGGRIEIDGWSATLYGTNLPADLLQDLKHWKLAIVYAAIEVAPINCVVCGGIAAVEEQGHWVCLGHAPTNVRSTERFKLAVRIATAREMAQRARKIGDTERLARFTAIYTEAFDAADALDREDGWHAARAA